MCFQPSQFISATNRHKADELLAHVREMWEREFAGKLLSNPKLGKLKQTLALANEHTGMQFLFLEASLQRTSFPIVWQFMQSSKLLQNESGSEISPRTVQK